MAYPFFHPRTMCSLYPSTEQLAVAAAAAASGGLRRSKLSSAAPLFFRRPNRTNEGIYLLTAQLWQCAHARTHAANEPGKKERSKEGEEFYSVHSSRETSEAAINSVLLHVRSLASTTTSVEEKQYLIRDICKDKSSEVKILLKTNAVLFIYCMKENISVLPSLVSASVFPERTFLFSHSFSLSLASGDVTKVLRKKGGFPKP